VDSRLQELKSTIDAIASTFDGLPGTPENRRSSSAFLLLFDEIAER
jgi:hypothetical protein